MGDLSAHFSLSEFECKHFGRPERCPTFGQAPDAALIQLLEDLRELDGRPLRIISGWRCRAYNAHVGGASRSQHLVGKAADLARGRFTVAQAVKSGARGVGHDGRWVVHVDTRRTSRPMVFLDR